jgi:membrane-bound lytic murein transglycosylase D
MMSTERDRPVSPAPPLIRVRTEDGRTLRFSRTFQIGRDPECDVCVEDGRVSREHVLVVFEGGRWRLRDQRSGNGVYVNGTRVHTADIEGSLKVRLGSDGPLVVLDVDSQSQPAGQPPARAAAAGETVLMADVAKRYFEGVDEGPVGGRTRLIRKAFGDIQEKQRQAHLKQRRLYNAIVLVLIVAALAVGGYAYYGHQQILKQQVLAEELFYDMKSLDVQIASVERALAASSKSQGPNLVQEYRERRRQLEASYDRYVSGLKLYDHALSPQEQLILRVTRTFGECEMAAPSDYLVEVSRYVQTWRSTGRFAKGVTRAREKGYVRKIVAEFETQNLPPQFFYLALQESDFDELASGPPTYLGFAKGMWQFVPPTAKRYGLTIGPLAGVPRPDPADDRHQWEKATKAAAAYIKEIYSTDAQASGLLVMASYNWGERRVVNALKKMPANPRERNFWKVLAQHRDQVPKETYDYVMMIVSAAAIGENPRLFGFPVDNPLAFQ